MTWMSSTDSEYPWKDSQGNVQPVEIKMNLNLLTVH